MAWDLFQWATNHLLPNNLPIRPDDALSAQALADASANIPICLIPVHLV